MQSSRLIVKNFGPLKDVDIEVRDFLCLIGKQATGKSTIAKLIAIFEDENFSQYFFIENLMDYGLYNFLNKETFISYKIDDDKESIFYFDFEYSKGKSNLKNFKTHYNKFFESKKINNFKAIDNKIDLVEQIEKHLITQFQRLKYRVEVKKINNIVNHFLSNTKKISNEGAALKVEYDLKDINNVKTLEYFSKILDDIEERLIFELNQCYDKLVEFIKFDSQYIPSERNFLHILKSGKKSLLFTVSINHVWQYSNKQQNTDFF